MLLYLRPEKVQASLEGAAVFLPAPPLLDAGVGFPEIVHFGVNVGGRGSGVKSGGAIRLSL